MVDSLQNNIHDNQYAAGPAALIPVLIGKVVFEGGKYVIKKVAGKKAKDKAKKEANEKAAESLSVKKGSPKINPKDVADKTPAQIDKLAKDKGLIPKGPNPQEGKGAYVDPATGKQRVLCHTNCSNPHGHVNNSQGQRLDINGKVVPPESPAAHLPINLP